MPPYPRGLPVHVSSTDVSDVHLAAQYQAVYGNSGLLGLPQVDGDADGPFAGRGDLAIDHVTILAAPIRRDGVKSIVFQRNADGSEFAEFDFGGSGSTDGWGAAGDSRTGGHHILSIAEAMARGLLLVVTQRRVPADHRRRPGRRRRAPRAAPSAWVARDLR